MSSSPNSGVLLAGRIDNLAWARVSERADHFLAPAFKQWARHEISQGYQHLVLDLEDCSGLDSTFLGTIASLIFETQKSGGTLEIVRANSRCYQILDRMGMTQLTKISQDLAGQEHHLAELNQAFSQWQTEQTLSHRERAKFSLDAHRELQKTSEENKLRFAEVVQVFEQELRDQT